MRGNGIVEVKLIDKHELEHTGVPREEFEIWYYTGILPPRRDCDVTEISDNLGTWYEPELMKFEFPEGDIYLDVENLRVFIDQERKGLDQLDVPEGSGNRSREQSRDPERTTLTNKISLNVSHSCNLACTYCYAGQGGYNHEEKLMSEETAIKAVEFLLDSTDYDQYQILFFGGEPLMNFGVIKRVVDRLTEIKGIDFYYNIVSNGTLCNDEIFSYLDRHRFSVLISVDGPAIVHDLNRSDKSGRPTFSRIRDNHAEYFSRLESVSARMVYTRNSTNIYENFIFLYDTLGFRDVSFRPVITKDEDFSAITPDNAELIADEYFKVFEFIVGQLAEGILARSRNLFDPVIQLLLNARKTIYCEAGQFNTVTPEGLIYPCPYFVYDARFLFGDIVNGVVHEENHRRFRTVPLSRKQPCSTCWARYLCGGGCRSASLFYYDRLHYRDEFCEVRKAYYERLIRWLCRTFLDNYELLPSIVKVYLEGITWKH